MFDEDQQGLDKRIIIEDWERDAEEVYADYPDPNYPALIPSVKVNHDKYTVATWWYTFFERHWKFRGMENALMDFYLYPDEVHRLYESFTNFYLRVMERAREELGVDAIFTSDDMGAQAGPLFSREIFCKFFKPYYKRIIDHAHKLGMHYWLHSCGNAEIFLDDLVEIGLDVLHPIQKYTMDQAAIARKYGDKICIWADFDVQQIIPYGTCEEVRAEVRRMIDTYARKDGRFMLTMGNGITPDWKLESLDALYDEAMHYWPFS